MANRQDWNRTRDQDRFTGPWKRTNESARPYDDFEAPNNELSSYRPSDDGRLAYGDRSDRSSAAPSYDRGDDRSGYTRADQGTRNDMRRTNYDRYSSQNEYRMGSDGTVPSSRGGYDRYASQQQDYGLGSDVYASRHSYDMGRNPDPANRSFDNYGRSDIHGRDMMNRNSFDENDYGRQSYYRTARSNPSSTYQGSYEATPSAGAYGLSKNFAGRGPKGWQRSDENIREQVCDRLEQDPHIDASEIEVNVASGVVTLAGKVDTRSTKRRAEDIVEGLAGVKDVRNELSVDQSFWQQAKEMVTGESKTDKTETTNSRAPVKSSSTSKNLSH